jgi:threonine synthase
MTSVDAKSALQIGKKAVQRCITAGCEASFGLAERIYVCPRCSGPLEIEFDLENAESIGDPKSLRTRWHDRLLSTDSRDKSGVWRHRELLPFDDDAPIVTLFEGNTPLYDAPRSAEFAGLTALRLKHQGCNPTASFKDTGMTTAVTQAALLGAKTVVCASTGNTAASLAAYSARAGLQCAILLPFGQVSAAKLAQSMDYGAAICEIDGNFDDCMRMIQELSNEPSIYVANSINPFRIEGQKTVAFEILEQNDWRVPEHIVVPGGNLGNSSALGKGFGEMLRLGLIDRLPKISVVQAEGAAPLAHLFRKWQQHEKSSDVPDVIEFVEHPNTLATAIKIGSPVSWKKAIRAVIQSHGQVISITEQELADAKAVIGRDGIGCEPASAATLAGIRKLVAAGKTQKNESVVAVLTGHVLKDPDYVSHYHRGTLAIESHVPGKPAARHSIKGNFGNAPVRVAANKHAILENLEKRH